MSYRLHNKPTLLVTNIAIWLYNIAMRRNTPFIINPDGGFYIVDGELIPMDI